MGLLKFFQPSRQKTAAVAKERLKILVAHERTARNRHNLMGKLQQELLEVIRKYVNVEEDAITIQMEQDDDREILEVNVILPDDEQEWHE